MNLSSLDWCAFLPDQADEMLEHGLVLQVSRVVCITIKPMQLRFNTGVIRCADGTEIEWGEGVADDANPTALERWKANRNASS